MATAATNPTVDELEQKEEELFRTGPLSVLTTSVKSNSQVCPSCTPLRTLCKEFSTGFRPRRPLARETAACMLWHYLRLYIHNSIVGLAVCFSILCVVAARPQPPEALLVNRPICCEGVACQGRC